MRTDQLAIRIPSRVARRLGPLWLASAALLLLIPGSLSAEELRLKLTFGGEQAPANLEVNLRWTATEESGKVHEEIRTAIPWSSVAALPALESGRWELEIEAEGWWSPLLRGKFPQAEGVIAVDLTPGGKIVGTMPGLASEWPPLGLRVSASPGSDLSLQPILQTCSVLPGESRFACRVPAGMLDLRLEPQGYAPSFRWDQQVEKGSTATVGTLALRAGGVVYGWVEALGEDPDLPF
ncbi:MAG: hypothetical protein AAF725_27870, partial [Acidobacteriota bacterium]